MMNSAEIRKHFLDFFRSKQHQIVPSAPIVVKNDPTLLFTNAGMNQFKDFFLGNKKAPFPRIADTQKCLRVSGKHNDLEEVGVDTYHHTMFEMLGNWSFGDYFKTEAIAWSWELLTSVFSIPADRLYVTIFEGDQKENLPEDKEAETEWKKWIAPERILRGNKKDNFWEMGDTGPCGPCTEIHVDCRPDEERKTTDGKQLVNADHPQVIEIWNNVFIQFNRLRDGSLEPLPEKHVDTGMGFERLVRVLQEKNSNYDTDIFEPVMNETARLTNKKYTGSDSKPDVAFRVLADHIRAISFTIADGQLPSNTGAGYVIRRILRRAVRYYYTYLDFQQPLLHQLVPVLANQFRDVFSELYQQQDFVAKVVKEEEDAFLRTLDKGLRKMDEIIENALGAGTGKIEGRAAFELYDTYGFPVDLTRLIASDRKLQVDEAGFEQEMKVQKDRSRAAGTLDAGDWTTVKEAGPSSFVGYNVLECEATVSRYRKIKTKGKELYQLVLDRTPFYAESGGQVGDTGTLQFEEEKIEVFDTKKENELIVHLTDKLPASLDGSVTASVNSDRRKKIMWHHSATHLLHAALRAVLGTHVAQKGSLVNDEYLRFDFSHFAKMSSEEIRKVEIIVNEKIRENLPVVIREMPKDEAIAMGAMALFGEKYADIVRVVIMDPNYSIELCGGTHVGNTGEIGSFRLIHETAVAAGVRRVEAVAGGSAEQYIDAQLEQLTQVKELLKNPKDLVKAITSLQEESASLRKRVEQAENQALAQLRNKLSETRQLVNGTSFIGSDVNVGNADALKKLAFELRNLPAPFLVVLTSKIDSKPFVAVSVSDDLVNAGLDANKIIKEKVAPLIRGGGGGQKTLATAGGQDTAQLDKVIDEIKSLLATQTA